MSQDPEQMERLSGLKAQHHTQFVWPSSVRMTAPDAALQSFKVWSSDAETIVEPSGEKAHQFTVLS